MTPNTKALPPLPGGIRLTMTERCELEDWRHESIRIALAAAPQATVVGHGGISSCGCSWIENVVDGKVVRSEHFCEMHMPAQQRPALVTALRGLLASLSRQPTEFELRAAAHEFTVMADRAAAAARAGGDDA
jgi:hypothetical protein